MKKEGLYFIFFGGNPGELEFGGESIIGKYEDIYNQYNTLLVSQEYPVLIFGKVLEKAEILYDITEFAEE